MKLTNRAKTKRAVLEIAQMTGRPFTRVSATFLDRLDAKLLETIRAEIHSHPSKGKTLQ